MFFFLAVISAFAYSFSFVLLTNYVRQGDSWSMGFYRNMSFVVTLAPLLLFADFSRWGEASDFIGNIALGAILAALCQFLFFQAIKILPVGIYTAISTGVRVLFAFVWGAVFLTNR